jgi:hypothetical protein
MRRLASFVADAKPHVMGICEIESGDALALATRFALQWAYRGRQALFWRAPVHALAVRDRYLPPRARRIFDRRGLLIVDAQIDTVACTLAATEFGADRESYVGELRFARTQLRGAAPALLFVQAPAPAKRFADLGFQERAQGVFVRGFPAADVRAATAIV